METAKVNMSDWDPVSPQPQSGKLNMSDWEPVSASPSSGWLSNIKQQWANPSGKTPEEPGYGIIPPILGQAVGKAGTSLNQAIQKGVGNAVEYAGKRFGETAGNIAAAVGTMPATISEAVLPKDELGAAGILTPNLPGAQMTTELATSERIPYTPPTYKDKLIGSMLSAKTGMPQRDAIDLAADPSIMGPGTLDKRTVGKLYDEFNKNMGLDTTSQKYKELFGSAYPLREGQIGKMQNMVEGVVNKLSSDPSSVQTEEAIFARQAARKLAESNTAKLNPQLASVARGHYDMLDDELSNRGLDSLKKIDQLYRRAVVKESASSILPQNKNMSPNALRTNIMALLGGKSIGEFLEGKPFQAAATGLNAALMSPRIGASVLGAQLPTLSGPEMMAARTAGGALENYYQQPRNPAPPLAPR